MANPALTDKRIQEFSTTSDPELRMTHAGVAKALGVFALFGFLGGALGWHEGSPSTLNTNTNVIMIVSILAAFGLSMIIIRRPKLARVLGVAYAILEGFAVGVVSAIDNVTYPGIVVEALGATVCVALAVWFLYGTGLIKVTAKVTRVITMAMIGAIAFYGVSILVTIFGGPSLDGSGGVLGIGISLVLAVIAASTFLIDFDRIDKLIAANAGAEYDYYGAFGLVLSFVWLYLEILNILGKLRGGGVGGVRR
jgi:uncharacterized YccA/Bax inhibitor family protein